MQTVIIFHVTRTARCDDTSTDTTLTTSALTAGHHGFARVNLVAPANPYGGVRKTRDAAKGQRTLAQVEVLLYRLLLDTTAATATEPVVQHVLGWRDSLVHSGWVSFYNIN